MICDKCGFYMDDAALTCNSCGAMLKRKPQKDEGFIGIRQGKPSSKPLVLQGRNDQQEEEKIYGERDFPGSSPSQRKTTAAYQEGQVQRNRRSQNPSRSQNEGAGRPQNTRGIAPVPHGTTQTVRIKNQYYKKTQKRGINWMKIGLVAAMLFVVAVIGVFVYLKAVPSGQRLSVRLGGEGPAQAYWQVGEGYMDEGKVNLAIATFEKADEKQREGEDKKTHDNLTGLLALGAAYEAAGRMDKAEELYRYLIEKVEVAKSRAEPYSNLIRILLATNRVPEGAVMMKTAHENTGEEAFIKQRNQTLPPIPEIADSKLLAGRYEKYITVPLASSQGFDIYYVVETGALATQKDPIEEGQLYTEPIYLDRSDTYRIRAVCVDGDLISDQLVVSYVVSLPLPPAPNASLSPGSYDKKQRIWLRHENIDNVKIYYTIDGSQPDTNSPVYDGEPVYLGSGKVIVKAIAIDEMNIVSNTFEREYKINAGKVLKQYNLEDTFTNLAIGKTLRDDFEKQFGVPQSSEELQGGNEAVKGIYSWGYAVSEMSSGRRVITKVYVTDGTLAAPRKTQIGMSVDDVTGKFRDLEQIVSPNGDRGIYSTDSGWGRMYQMANPNEQIVEYGVGTAEGTYWLLRYHVRNGKVVAISHLFYSGQEIDRSIFD